MSNMRSSKPQRCRNSTSSMTEWSYRFNAITAPNAMPFALWVHELPHNGAKSSPRLCLTCAGADERAKC